MSVILYEYDECEGIAKELVKLPDLEKVVMSNSYVMKYNYKFEDVIGRLLWYMYVANRVAYSLQYQQNVDLFVKEKKAKEYTPEKARMRFGGLNYNIYTNSDTVFLSSEWLGLVSDIQKFIEEKYPTDATFYL